MLKRDLWLRMEAFNNMSSKLIPKLTEAIGKLRNTKYTDKDIENAEFSEIIRLYTGINATVYVGDVGLNAMYRIPTVDNNHPFFKQLGLKNLFGSEAGLNITNASLPIKGTVDHVNYKVSGVYSEIPVSVIVGSALLKSDKFTDAGVATIITHELGHAFDYFDLLGELVYDSWVVSSAARTVAGASSVETKQKTLVKTKEALDMKELDVNALIHNGDLTQQEVAEAVLISNSHVTGFQASGTKKYDQRTIEQKADAFVVAHGGGRDYAKAMATLYKETRNVAAMNSVTYTALELLKVMWFLVLLYGAPLLCIVWAIRLNPSTKMYDDPHERLALLKQHLVGHLRDANTPEEKALLSSDIDAIDEVLKTIKDRKTVFDMVYERVYPTGRTRKSEEAYMADIRTLVFNELQHKAIKLRNL